MRIDPMNAIVGVSAGGIDEVLTWWDEKNGKTEPFQTATDWGRVGITVLAYLGQAFNFFPQLAAPLAQSESALFTKTVISAIRAQMGTGVTRSTRTTRTTATGGRYPAPTTQREFANIRM